MLLLSALNIVKLAISSQWQGMLFSPYREVREMIRLDQFVARDKSSLFITGLVTTRMVWTLFANTFVACTVHDLVLVLVFVKRA